jgi:hypothetical protein
MRLRAFDALILAAGAALVAGAALWAYAPGSGTPRAVVTGAEGEWIFPLDVTREVRIAGPLGETVILIEDGTARIADSPCPNKTCAAAGALSRPGQWSACLPNKVLLRIEGGRDDDGIDAIVY